MSEGELGTPLLCASPELEDGTFGTDDGEQSTTWTPQDSPRHMRVVSGGQASMFSPFAAYRESNMSHTSKHGAAYRESRARRTSWISIDTLGRSTIFQADKRALLQRFQLRLPVRDMRMVDPNLLTSETGKILVRDNGIVVSVEHVRLIIMAEQVIVTKDGHEERPLTAAFVEALQSAIGSTARERERRMQAESALAEDADDDTVGKARKEVAPLPFELVVLEAALGDVCAVLARLAKELELQAHPALEALTRDVTTANLERVRKVKTRHQRLVARVTTVREELERFLEDDDDMAKMCLTRRREVEAAAALATAPSAGNTPEPSASALSRSIQRQSSISYASRRLSLPSRPSTAHGPGSPRGGIGGGDADGTGETDAEADAEALEAVENLLESYFVQIDGTFDKLEAIGEYVEDTEQYINIELDSSRNRLIKLEVVLTAGTFALAIFTLIGGILGENVVIPPAITHSVKGFWAVNGVTALVCIVVFYIILTYIRIKKLL